MVGGWRSRGPIHVGYRTTTNNQQQKHYCYQDRDAIDHLLRVAFDIDSVIVGEPEILGQLKEAYRLAQLHAGVGASLSQVTEAVLAAYMRLCCRFRHAFAVMAQIVAVGASAVG